MVLAKFIIAIILMLSVLVSLLRRSISQTQGILTRGVLAPLSYGCYSSLKAC